MSIKITDDDYLTLQRLEEELWLAETRFDRDYMDKVMSPDFFEFGRSGRVYSKDDCLSFEGEQIDAVIPLQNLQIRLLTHEVAQVTYDSEVNYEGMVEKGRRSSIWTKNDGIWQLRFHQGTAFE